MSGGEGSQNYIYNRVNSRRGPRAPGFFHVQLGYDQTVRRLFYGCSYRFSQPKKAVNCYLWCAALK